MGKMRHQEVKELAKEVGLGFEPMLCSFHVPTMGESGKMTVKPGCSCVLRTLVSEAARAYSNTLTQDKMTESS